MKKVTIQDIADALGISRNTVSKAINNADGLADATREKILQKAVEMGYKQFSYFNAFTAVSGSGEGPRTMPGYQGEIALFTGAFLTQSHFASLMLDKFQREISQLGYTLNTHRITPEELAEKRLRPAGAVCGRADQSPRPDAQRRPAIHGQHFWGRSLRARDARARLQTSGLHRGL